MAPHFNDFERYIDSTMCVSFQFLRYPNMRVCEADFIPRPKTGKDTKIVFKIGKSCMFSVHSDETRTIPSEFNLKIVVCQRMKCNDERQLLGEAVVSLGHSFINLLQPPTNMSLPATGMRYDLFPLKDPAGKVVGSLAAFARISCFGKLIVTQFQLAQEQDANYMFKGTEADKLFKESDMDIPNIDYEEEEEDEDGIPKDTPYDEIFGYPKGSEEEFHHETLSEEQSEFEEGEYSSAVGDVLQDPCMGLGKSGEPEIYKEMGAVVNGHTIIIRVLKKRKKEKKSIDSCSTQQIPCCCPPEPPVCPFAPKLNVCDCDFPIPPELIPRCPTQCCQSPPPPCPPVTCCQSPPPPCPPVTCCQSPPPPCPPVTCCQSPPPSSPPVTCCPCAIPNKIPSLQSKIPSQINKPVSCPKVDCSNLLNSSCGLQITPMTLEPGTVAMKGDEVFFQSSSKPGEPLSDKEMKLTNSLYYKTKCGERLKDDVVQNDVEVNGSHISTQTDRGSKRQSKRKSGERQSKGKVKL